MITLDAKVPESLINKAQGFISLEKLQAMQQQENAALAMCGGLLGNCYLLSEVVENLMVDTLGKLKKEKWYKHQIKWYFNRAKDELHKTISTSTNNSPTNGDYMREVADALYELLKLDLFKLKNAILLELNKLKIPYADYIADILVIDILLRYINMEYDDVIAYMNTIFKAFYDSWYYPAKCEGPTKLWQQGLELVSKQFVKDEIDLNGIPTIKNGIAIIQNKMHSAEVADAAKNEASQYAEDGGGQELYSKALNILGIQ